MTLACDCTWNHLDDFNTRHHPTPTRRTRNPTMTDDQLLETLLPAIHHTLTDTGLTTDQADRLTLRVLTRIHNEVLTTQSNNPTATPAASNKA